MPRQFRHGWSYNDAASGAGHHTIVDAPVEGKRRVVEVVRFSYTGGATNTWRVQITGPAITGPPLDTDYIMYEAPAVAPGGYMARGPFVLIPGYRLTIEPSFLPVTGGEGEADWIEY